MSSLNQEIDKLAAQWAAKRDLGELSPEEQRAFEAWLSADIRHLGAYGRAEAVLSRIERLNNIAADPPKAGESKWMRRRYLLGGGLAASVVAVLAAARLFDELESEEVFTTPLGQVRQVVLSDGSVVSLNTNSQVKVRFSRKARNIHLVRGEALFDVAKNRKRPFIVTAAYTTVRAVGTSFAVSVLPRKPIQVLIREGVVELQRTDSPLTSPLRAGANIHVTAPLNAPVVTQALPGKQVMNDLAWRYGQISFDNRSLKEAAEEFARYSEVAIVIDPDVADHKITGLFAANDPVGFARAAAGVLDLQTIVDARQVKIINK